MSQKDLSQIKPCLLVVMGVSGCGKSTVAKRLQQQLGWPFQEGDALHPKANIIKMSSGISLSDEDRTPWLVKCHEWLQKCEQEQHGKGILTCSALKRKYRDILKGGIKSPFYFVYLTIDQKILLQRIEHRQGHFMPPSLLSSQLETLEPPQQDESFISIDMSHSVEKAVQDIIAYLEKL